ncbi:MAG: hypothetical protein LBS29_04975 [Endomicrobium sp.]|jgi:hypothetical protein|nr:hypothetical protein [Endomicrobium sp.]
MLKQGEEYNQSMEEESIDKEPSRLNKKLVILIIAGIFVVVIFAVSLRFFKAKEVEEVPVEEDPIVWYFEYFPEEVEQLRAVGYTGDEIEYHQAQETPAQLLIEDAKAVQEVELKAIYDKIFDAASDEYRELENMTWVGGKAIQITDTGNYTDYSAATFKENVDFDKVPPHGMQLYIRCELPDGQYAFMSMHPTRWVQLKDNGNIVIEYTIIEYGGAKVITSIKEVPQ